MKTDMTTDARTLDAPAASPVDRVRRVLNGGRIGPETAADVAELQRRLERARARGGACAGVELGPVVRAMAAAGRNGADLPRAAGF